MADVLKHKRGTAAPVAGNLVVGEVALNTTDGVVYTKTDGGAVRAFARRYEETFTATGGKTVTHGLGTRYVVVSVYNSSGVLVVVGVSTTSTSALDLVFSGTLTNAVVVVIG